jgi:small subunit ribosomal protein S20
MPIIKASIKDLRQSGKHRVSNRIVKNRLKDAIKDIVKLAKQGKIDEVKKQLPIVTSLIDKAAKKNLIHKNNAANKKSNLSKLLVTK